MVKATLRKAVHAEHILWLHIEPSASAVYALNEIVRAVDPDAQGFIAPDTAVQYESFVPKRFTHHDVQGVYAISIFTAELVDFILLKEHPLYHQVGQLIRSQFDLDEGLASVPLMDAAAQAAHQEQS